MVRKPARMYRQIKGQAYCRREYMGGVPGGRISQFDLGNMRFDFPIVMSLVIEEPCQIRDISLEAARIAANRFIQKKAGAMGYHLKLLLYPHFVIRENKMATGAGADRVSSGMRGAFGKPVGTAVRVKSGQKLMMLRTNTAFYDDAKEALWRAGMKLPSPIHVVVEQGSKEL
ncbi:MAG: 50S ribosomal protein L16 [Euryarchaeota archaeon]|nr:50S ribosomal protein L16 [Euryarchaeota archaeon]